MKKVKILKVRGPKSPNIYKFYFTPFFMAGEEKLDEKLVVSNPQMKNLSPLETAWENLLKVKEEVDKS